MEWAIPFTTCIWFWCGIRQWLHVLSTNLLVLPKIAKSVGQCCFHKLYNMICRMILEGYHWSGRKNVRCLKFIILIIEWMKNKNMRLWIWHLWYIFQKCHFCHKIEEIFWLKCTIHAACIVRPWNPGTQVHNTCCMYCQTPKSSDSSAAEEHNTCCMYCAQPGGSSYHICDQMGHSTESVTFCVPLIWIWTLNSILNYLTYIFDDHEGRVH